MLRTGIFATRFVLALVIPVLVVSVVDSLPVFLFNSACGEVGWVLCFYEK